MKKLCLNILLVAFLCNLPVIASCQKINQKTVSKEVEKLNDKRAMDVLKYARTLYKPEPKAELKNIIKNMSDNELRLLYDFVEVVGKYGDEQEKQFKEQTKPIVRQRSKFKFESTSFDFGTIVQGDTIVHNYNFTNVGDGPLEIANIKTTCGCTVPSWPSDKIMPGESGTITLVFDSKAKLGIQSKKATIFANTDPQTTYLFIMGQIMKKRD